MTVTQLIKSRRSIFPKSYNDKPIPKETIQQILENANWAPNHKKTEPWRFKVFHSQGSREDLGNYIANWYKETMPSGKFLEKKYKKLYDNPTKSACVIAICMQRDKEERVPEWEEVAAVACAVQNMHLTCTELGIGAYWSSTKAIISADEFLNLTEGERCLGLFFMGNYENIAFPAKRQPIENKVVWR